MSTPPPWAAAARQHAATRLPRTPGASSTTARPLSSGRVRVSRWIGQFGNHRQRMRVMVDHYFSPGMCRLVDLDQYAATCSPAAHVKHGNRPRRKGEGGGGRGGNMARLSFLL